MCVDTVFGGRGVARTCTMYVPGMLTSCDAGIVMYCSCAKLLLSSTEGVMAGASSSFCPGNHTPLQRHDRKQQ